MQHSHDFINFCQDARTRVPEVTVLEVVQMLQDNTLPCLIDVREAEEYAVGHLPQAHHLSKGWIEAKIHHLVPHKETKVVLYCGGGNRSLLAADNLKKMGYRNVFSMQGGYRGWVAR